MEEAIGEASGVDDFSEIDTFSDKDEELGLRKSKTINEGIEDRI